MTRKKVKVAFIENESVRKSTFKKRKRGIFKKAHELATLCDVPICVLIKSEYDSIPEVWPSREEANKVLSQWEMMPEMSKTKKMVNQETFLLQRISKATESLKKLWRENRELEMKELMFSCFSGKTLLSDINKNDLPDLGCFIDQYLKDLNRRIEILRTNDVSGAGAATTSNAMPMLMVDLHSSSAEFYNKIRIQIENNLNKIHEEMG
ncbi:Agamous-like MADS-box protein AGL80 [Cardamine amara subsp. amara]|uniref:Agamous-like MADS-box protein AGL80 n=1 Tax=Cardamine amara subsp. amara TaxID=228776 RepID=A0ABD1AB99_CARAN